MKDDGRVDRAGAWYRSAQIEPAVYDGSENVQAERLNRRQRRSGRKERARIREQARTARQLVDRASLYQAHRDRYIRTGDEADLRAMLENVSDANE